MAVAGKKEEFLSVKPPHSTAVGSDGKADVLNVLVAIDYSD